MKYRACKAQCWQLPVYGSHKFGCGLLPCLSDTFGAGVVVLFQLLNTGRQGGALLIAPCYCREITLQPHQQVAELDRCHPVLARCVVQCAEAPVLAFKLGRVKFVVGLPAPEVCHRLG